MCQDIIYIGSRGKCRTPKHIGLGIALHQLTQSRDAVELINKNGHGISYDEVRRIDTSWALQQQTDDGIIIPPNIKPGIPLRAAGDNFNRATESLEGKHLDIVNMVLYQADKTDTDIHGDFGPIVEQLNVNRRKTLKDIKVSEILECPNLQGKQPGPRHLLNKVNMAWFQSCSDLHKEERAMNMAYIELRMMPIKLFEMQLENLESQIPGWTVFHAYVSHKLHVPTTRIGYCPMIPASATEFNTVYTMMKVFKQLFRALGQEWTYITYDEAIYSKAQMIKWRNMDEFKDDEMEMGGMHRAMNFMGDIGKVMEESGFEDIIVEGDLYGPSVVQVIMKGKAYNRGVRTHKIMNETMQRLKWKAFQKWVEENEIQIPDEDKESTAEDVMKIRGLLLSKRDINDDDEVKSAVNSFIEHSACINNLLHDFTAEGCNKSYTFLFWETYINDLSQLLMDYIAAKRDGIRDLELETFAEMIPYDFVCGHTNYARWGTLNVTEGYLLKQSKPEFHEVISKEQSAVYRTNKPFSGVWHDMALEQSLNRECGKFKQLYTNEGALQKYYLTAHRKAEVTKNVKLLSGFLESSSEELKEASAERIKKDESAIQKIIAVVEERMTNPFEFDTSATEDERQPLINIATSGVASEEIQNDLCKAREMGQKRLQEFVEERLQNNRTDFMAPIPKQTIKTFSTLNKPMKIKTHGKVESVNIDRQIFSKLTIIAQSREVDIKTLLNYELTPVPLALFNLDGTMRKTTKSMTMSWIEGQHAVKQLPENEHPTLLVIDLMMLLRIICTDKSDCKTFGDISSNVLSAISGMNYKYTALVGHNYQSSESIKSAERTRRGVVQMQEIRNPRKETPLPRQKLKFLSNPANKLNLADYVCRDLEIELQKQLPDNMTVFLGGGFKDPKRAVKVEKNVSARVEALESDHEEADSRMFVHIDHAVKELSVKSVVLWSLDSDVAAICPRMVHLLDIKLFFKTGLKEQKRIIPMHDIASELGERMPLALPVIHALSGCDSTSSFFNKGKKTWFATLEKYPLVLEGIMDIGEHPVNITERAVKSVNQAVSEIYCGKLMNNTDDARYELFSKKGLSSEKLPPTSDALYMHIRRVNYQTYIWKSSTEPIMDLPSPLDGGWTSDKDGHLVPLKMTQASAPEALLDFTKCSCKTECKTKRCKCMKEDILCTDVCFCDNEICLNRIEYSVSSDSEDDG